MAGEARKISLNLFYSLGQHVGITKSCNGGVCGDVCAASVWDDGDLDLPTWEEQHSRVAGHSQNQKVPSWNRNNALRVTFLNQQFGCQIRPLKRRKSHSPYVNSQS